MKQNIQMIRLSKKTGRVTLRGNIIPQEKSTIINLSQEAKPEEQNTTDENYAKYSFRFISSHIFYGLGFPLDMSGEGVLTHDTAPLFNHLTVFTDHCTTVSNWIGKTQNSSFDNTSEPKGINSQICIDRRKSDTADIILGLDTGALGRCSITYDFEFEQSHPKMNEDRFWNSLGETVDGELVRVVVTKVLNVYEVSLVWYGADHSAQKLEAASTANTAISQKINNDSKENNNMTLLEKLKATYLELVKDSSITIDTEGDLVQAIKTVLNENASLTATKKKLEAQVQRLKLFETFHADLIQEIKNSCTAAAKLLNGTGATEPSTTHALLIEQTNDYDRLVALQEELEKEKRKLFPVTCQHCGEPVGEIRSSVEMQVAGAPGSGAVTSQAKKEGPIPASGI